MRGENMTLTHWFTQHEAGGFPIAGCDLSVSQHRRGPVVVAGAAGRPAMSLKGSPRPSDCAGANRGSGQAARRRATVSDFRAVLVFALGVAGTPALADVANHAHLETTAEWPVCVGGSDPLTSFGITFPTSLKNIVDTLDRVELLVPNVPPEEAHYIENEEKAALEVQDNYQRYNILTTRPYFIAWRLHSDFDNIRKELNNHKGTGTYRLTSSDEIRKYISSLLGLFYTLQEAVRHWTQFTTQSTPPPTGHPAVFLSHSSIDLENYLTCLLELLGNKQ
jgi:hypothetical protein